METEIRVRPVVRHAVTRFTKDGKSAGSEMIGEFANEAYAEELAEALRKSHRAKQYVIIQRSFEFDAKVGYADHLSVAQEMKRELEDLYGGEFRIYERELTDPMAIARVSLETEEMALFGYQQRKRIVNVGADTPPHPDTRE
jgi:predicted DNA-binding WGR domain protein